MKLWEGLEQDFNYNAMVSQRGIVNIFHSDSQRDSFVRRGNAMLLSGADAEMLNTDELKAICPFLDYENARFPIKGALLQKRGGTVRHDAVAWGYARGADNFGVDIIQNCEVIGLNIEKGVCKGVITNLGNIAASKIASCVAGSSGKLMSYANLRLPIESHVLQAFVSEGLKPIIPGVITFGAGHFYVSQSDKGGLVFGGDIDGYNSYAQRGNLPVVEDVCEGGMAIMPMIGRARILRIWGGVMDMSMDGSPFIDKTSVKGLYFNGGWCYGGFKATPASGLCYAHLIATDEPHEVAKDFRLDRFTHGKRICKRVARANTPVFFKSNAVILNDGKGNGLILYEACSKFVCNVCFIVIGGFWPLLSIFACHNSRFKELNIFNIGCVMAAHVSNFYSFKDEND